MKNISIKEWLAKVKNRFSGPDSDNEPEVNFANGAIPITSITLYKADGGMIAETYRYNKDKEEYITRLYLINHDQDVGKRIGQILVLETLRE